MKVFTRLQWLIITIMLLLAAVLIVELSLHGSNHLPDPLTGAITTQPISHQLTPVRHLTEEPYSIYCGTHKDIINDLRRFNSQLFVSGLNGDEDGILRGYVDADNNFVIYLIFPDRACLLEASIDPEWFVDVVDVPKGEQL